MAESKPCDGKSSKSFCRSSPNVLGELHDWPCGYYKPADECAGRLPGEASLNVDETGHKENREKFWTWCFRASRYTLFRMDKSRGSEVLIEVLGTEFDGVLGCDYFSAYRRYMRECNVLVQFCMAHLIRDVKFLLTLPGRGDRAYGRRLRDALRELFAVIHRREQMTKAGFRQALEAARRRVLWVGTTAVPHTKHARKASDPPGASPSKQEQAAYGRIRKPSAISAEPHRPEPLQDRLHQGQRDRDREDRRL